jgi:amino acid transporter
VTVNEETEDSSTAPGRAAIVSTFVLVGIYLLVATAAQAFGGVTSLASHPTDVLAPLGNGVLGSPLNKLLVIAVLSSASASTQTTILPTARTTLSMARMKAIPKAFGNVHPRFLSPGFSTIWMGVVSTLVYVLLSVTSPVNLIGDAFTSLALTIAFYYGFTGFACVIFYRRELFKSVKNFLYIGVLPMFGGLVLTWVLIKAVLVYSKPHAGFAKPFLGIGSPIAIALFMIVLGIVLMIVQRITMPEFFKRKLEVVDPSVLADAPAGRTS